jgi:predicted DNA-binding transcriptional regulator YafY
VKVHRLLAITMQLLNRKRMSGQELAEQFEVSLRTIYRDLETINSAGIPIVSYSGANGGYEIMDQYHIDRQIVTLDDLDSIMTALKGVQASLDDRNIDHLMAKVGALIDKSEHTRLEEAGETLLFNTVSWRGRGTPLDKGLLAELRQAAKKRNVINFGYPNAEGTIEERIAEPVGLAWKGFAWYLYAYCRLRDDYRTFRLSRIKELRVERETFTRRNTSLEELDAKWGNPSQRTDSVMGMVLRFHPRMRVRVEEYFQPEEITVAEDGYFIVRSKHSVDGWLMGTLLSYGADVKVLEPKHLADSIRERALEVARQYE